MGKQLQLHMLPEDAGMLLDFIQKESPVVVTLKSAESAIVAPVSDPHAQLGVMTLWNQRLVDSLSRKKVHRAAGGDYYRIDDSLPTLEFAPSRLIEWIGRPALLQGRIYGFFDRPDSAYEDWYKSIIHWTRRNFTKNPLKLLDGYVGPRALSWFHDGGVLLPMFEPPPTSEWLSFVKNQHTVGSSTP